MNARWIYVPLFILPLIAGCTAEPLLESDLEADDIAGIDLATDDVLREVEHLTQTYDAVLSTAGKHRTTVYVPAGSNDALADALAEAGPGGTVILKAGLHYESDTVPVTQTVLIIGEPGAKLLVDTQPMPVVDRLDPALHVMDASRVVIWGIEFLPAEAVGGTAILAQRAPRLVVGRSTIREYQEGVVIDRSDHALFAHNTFVMSQDESIGITRGITIVNGAHARVVSNTVSDAFLGIFAGDEKGRMIGNELTNSVIGTMFCRIPGIPAPNGDLLSADISATKWIAAFNNAHGNSWGYLIIDGASKNFLSSTNRASNNALYDIELAGDSQRFGFFTPFSFDNKVFVKEADTVIKDCGVDNTVRGGTLVDTGEDPCF